MEETLLMEDTSADVRMTLLDYDISIDLGCSELYVLIARNTPIPFKEETCELRVLVETNLRVYRGLVASIEGCTLWYELPLTNVTGTDGRIQLSYSIDDHSNFVMKLGGIVIMNESWRSIEFASLLEMARPFLLNGNDRLIRDRIHAKSEFIDYIETAKLTLLDPVVKASIGLEVSSFMEERLGWAEQIVHFPDVTGEEYRACLTEIRSLVEPYFDRFKREVLKGKNMMDV